jgi:hypothetical protein
MEIVNTIAPISIENLKKYFINKDVMFLIDYDTSQLTGQKLLTYVSNLDIPCNIAFDITNLTHQGLLKEYLHSGSIINVASLELAAIDCLLEYKGISNTNTFKTFISDNLEIIKEWVSRLDSLVVYNMYTVNDDNFKKWAMDHQPDDADTSSAVNFVSILKYPHFYSYYSIVDEDNLKYYTTLFNDYCFKGKNIFQYWANENNPMFLTVWGLTTGHFNIEDYVTAIRIDAQPHDAA